MLGILKGNEESGRLSDPINPITDAVERGHNSMMGHMLGMEKVTGGHSRLGCNLSTPESH